MDDVVIFKTIVSEVSRMMRLMRALQHLHCKSSLMLVDQQGIYIFHHTKLPKIINVKVHRHIDNCKPPNHLLSTQSSTKPKESKCRKKKGQVGLLSLSR